MPTGCSIVFVKLMAAIDHVTVHVSTSLSGAVRGRRLWLPPSPTFFSQGRRVVSSGFYTSPSSPTSHAPGWMGSSPPPTPVISHQPKSPGWMRGSPPSPRSLDALPSTHSRLPVHRPFPAQPVDKVVSKPTLVSQWLSGPPHHLTPPHG